MDLLLMLAASIVSLVSLAALLLVGFLIVLCVGLFIDVFERFSNEDYLDRNREFGQDVETGESVQKFSSEKREMEKEKRDNSTDSVEHKI